MFLLTMSVRNHIQYLQYIFVYKFILGNHSHPNQGLTDENDVEIWTTKPRLHV